MKNNIQNNLLEIAQLLEEAFKNFDPESDESL